MVALTSSTPTSTKNRNIPTWDDSIWQQIDRAVHDECKRTTVASKFLPLYGPVLPDKLTIPSDTIKVDAKQKMLYVEETAVNDLIELVVKFSLTEQQVQREGELGTAVTLATRAANLLSQALDVVIFQGKSYDQHPLFTSGKVSLKSGKVGLGLLEAASKDIQVVYVEKTFTPPSTRWGENTFRAVAEAYSRLQSGEELEQAHYGPYALVLHHVPFADTFAPLTTTLIMPADRIKPLVTWVNPKMKEKEVEFYGTGTLPEYSGVLVSLGGNTMDLVVGVDARTEVVTQDTEGNYDFRVFKRFALRLKDRSAVMRLEFEDSEDVGELQKTEARPSSAAKV